MSTDKSITDIYKDRENAFMYGDANFVQTLPLEAQPDYTTTVSQELADHLAYMEPRRKNSREKYIHISAPAKWKTELFGKEKAIQLVNAQGTLCKKCQEKAARLSGVLSSGESN